MPLTQERQQELDVLVSRVFSPAAPIREQQVFAGRKDQLRTVIDAINQPGQHAIVYGERGVGKTSLANVVANILQSDQHQIQIIAPHINCDGTDTFSSIWHKVFSRIPMSIEQQEFGFSQGIRVTTDTLASKLPEEITPEHVIQLAQMTAASGRFFVPIIDEFDRLEDEQANQLITDTIKTLSDQYERITVVLVGVANTVNELIAQHQSIERALVQIHMPRMSRTESTEILTNGMKILELSIEEEAKKFVATLSQGLPTYTHQLGLHATRQAIDQLDDHLTLHHIDRAIFRVLEGTQQSLKSAYHTATMSPRKDNLYSEALLACALAIADEMGFFAPADMRGPLSKIMGRPYDIPQFQQHLGKFCEETRGPILQRVGESRRYRYRFMSPLLQPYVVMKGLAEKKITREELRDLQNR